jgi:hypothetical protein
MSSFIAEEFLEEFLGRGVFLELAEDAFKELYRLLLDEFERSDGSL